MKPAKGTLMRSARRLHVVLLLAIVVGGGFPHAVRATGSADTLAWESVSPGVNFAIADSASGHDLFIGLGGYTVKQAWANNWVSKLREAKLRGLGTRYFYAVAGPAEDGYSGREIGTLNLARHLLSRLQDDSAINRIVVAAHSSGAYVAHALFQDLYDGASIDSTHLTDGKILYFCLDGGIGANGSGVEITQTMAARLGHITAVYAVMPSERIYSPGYDEMLALGRLFGTQSSSLLVNAAGCGCTAKWCVHETVINQKPYNHATFDLENDYSHINADHPVATSYLDGVTSMKETWSLPEGFLLQQNYPNPFNPKTVVSCELSVASRVRLAVYDLLGREVGILLDDQKSPGTHRVEFDGSGLSSGIYICRMAVGDHVDWKKMVLLR